MTPPAATAASVTPPRLPVPRAALSALDQCRRPQPPAMTASLSTTIIRAALADGHSLPSPSLLYVTRRLLNGVSASAGASRLNYSIVLVGLTRQLAASGTQCALDELLAAVRKIYGPKGSFELGYSGAERERALGTLAATAALVAGMEPASLSAATARELVGLLRSTCDGAAARWRLGCSAVHVVKRLLTVVKTDEKGSAVKPMWTWCEDRREKEDGLQMAFMLRDAGLVRQNAFRKLYPTLEDGFETALLDTFESGFSCIGEHAVVGDHGGKVNATYDVPYGWSMAVRYVLTPEGADHLGDVSHFWHSVVLDKLVRGSRSGEKKLLAIELIPLVLAEVNDVKTFETVFERSVASMIAVILGTRRGTTSVLVRKNRTSDDVMKRMTESAKTLGERMVTQIREKDVNMEGNRPLLRAFMLWAVRGGILNQLLPPPHLSEALATFQHQDVKTLFSEAVEEFAQPRNDGYNAREFKDVCNSSRRASILRFIFVIAKEHDFLAKDAIRVVTLYCIFKQDGQVSTKEELSLMKFDTFQKWSLPATWCGILPDLKPCLSVNVAALGFRRLVDFLTGHRRDDHVDVLPAFCMRLISSIVSSKKLCLKPRKFLSTGAHAAQDQNFLVLQKTAIDTVEKLSYASGDDKAESLSRSLRIVAIFLYLFIYNPQPGEVSENIEDDEKGGEVLTLFRKVDEYADYIFEGVPEKVQSAGPENPQNQATEEVETPPAPVEYIAHLISDLCGRDAASFRQIATMAIEALGCALDDRVIAVLFDAMDSYLSGESVEISMPALDDHANDDRRDESENEGDVGNMKHISDEESEDSDDVDSDGVEPTKLAETENEAVISAIPNRNGGDSNEGYEDMNDDSEEEIDVDMDIDKEDPGVLAEFDKRLGSHLRLLKQEKKAANRRKLRAEFRYVRVSRILDVVEAIARVLRMRLERSQVLDSRLPVVFLDLHVRLYEFVLDDGAKNFRFLKQVCSIVSKQMLVHTSVFMGKVSDAITVSEISGRFLEVLRCCRTDRKVPDTEARIISRSAGFLTGVAVSLSKGDYLTYLPTYRDILVSMLKPGSHFWTPGMFNSFLQKAPIPSLNLLSSITEALTSSEMTKKLRQTASELFLVISLAACKVDDEGLTDVVKFWDTARICLLKHCIGNSARNWNSEGYANMIQIAANGLRRGHFRDADDLSSQLKTGVEAAALSNRERTRLFKLLKKPEKLPNNKRPIADVVTSRRETVPKATPVVAEVRKQKKRKATGEN